MRLKANLFFLLFLLPALGLFDTVYSQSLEAIKAAVQEFTLDNGMKFIVLERHEAPVASFHVYANVGSVNETYGITGISHLLEHMAFKGSKVVGTSNYGAEKELFPKMDDLYDKLNREKEKVRPDTALIASYTKEFEDLLAQAKQYVVNGEYTDMMMREGDEGVNAYTSWDATQYINSLPSNRLEFWMAMTSDRFLNPVFREFYKEKDVVMEERRLGLETQPIGKLIEDFLAVTFKAHPYHHHVIGHMSDLEKITHQDVIEYFSRYYSPSNLTAAIVGDVKIDELRDLAKLYFGRIPSNPRPEQIRTVEPEQWGERQVKVKAKSQPILIVGYHRPATSHEDNSALEALANIIGQGRSSRLYEKLVKEKKIAIEVGTFNGFPGNKFPNLIAFFAMSSVGHTSAECLAAIDEEIAKIKEESVSAEDLQKYKRSTMKGLLDSMKANDNMAAQLTFNDVVLGDWRLLFDDIKKVEAITAEDVKRVAGKYLVADYRTIGEVVPEESTN
jgi:predicted Zn-dependent peptidase